MRTSLKPAFLASILACITSCSKEEAGTATKDFGDGRTRFEIREFSEVRHAIFSEDFRSYRVVHCRNINLLTESRRSEVAVINLELSTRKSADQDNELIGGLLLPLEPKTACVDLSTRKEPEQVQGSCGPGDPILTFYRMKPMRAYKCLGKRPFVTSFNATSRGHGLNQAWSIAVEFDWNPQ